MVTKNFKANLAKSSIAWTGKKITGQHDGTINLTQGEIEVENGKITSGRFDIDTTSIVILDIQDPATNAQFKEHLFDDDFFAVAKFPSAHFTLFNVSHLTGNRNKVDGTLTIKDITHALSFEADIEMSENTIIVKGEIVVDRTKYGMKYSSGNFFKGLGDKLVHNDFILRIQSELSA
jgi:polyisoprenoid-binding protein YceI